MTYEIRISKQAEQDLRGLFEYIAFELRSPGAAAGQLNRIEDAIYTLDTFPERYSLISLEPWKSRNLRILPVDNYCVFYIPDNETRVVTVIRIIYSGRDIEKQLTRYTSME